MDARGNKISSCKIPDQVIKLLELWQLWLKKEKKIANTIDLLSQLFKEKKSKYNRVVITTLKSWSFAQNGMTYELSTFFYLERKNFVFKTLLMHLGNPMLTFKIHPFV